MHYECDPERNTKCNKRACHINGGPCIATKNPVYAKCRVCNIANLRYRTQFTGIKTAKYCPECGRKIEEVER